MVTKMTINPYPWVSLPEWGTHKKNIANIHKNNKLRRGANKVLKLKRKTYILRKKNKK